MPAPADSSVSTAPVPPPATRLQAVAPSPVRQILALTQRPEVISFAGGLPAPDLFDADAIRAAYTDVLTTEPHRALQYSPTEGDPALRSAIAERTTKAGLPTDPDDILITTGSQQGLTLIATALLDPGDTVLVTDPGYLAALQCFQLAGAKIVPVPTDDEGPEVTPLEEAVRRLRPKFLYVVPTFHNPTGRTINAHRRAEIARIAAKHGLWIVEDDPYGELRYDGSPLPPLAAYPAAADRTIRLSSLSKIVAPGLRIGWLHAPATIRSPLVIAKQASDLHTSTVDQAAAARYLTTSDLPGHLESVRAIYRQRRDAMLAALPTTLPPGSRWTEPAGGMFVWATLPTGYDTTALLPRAVANNVAYVPGAPFYAGAADPTTMRLSFITHAPNEITEGLRRLRETLLPSQPCSPANPDPKESPDPTATRIPRKP